MRSPAAFWAVVVLMGALTANTAAQTAPHHEPLVNYDRRAQNTKNVVAPAAATAAGLIAKVQSDDAVAKLRAALPDVRIDKAAVMGVPVFIRSTRGFLTGPGGSGRSVGAVAALAANDANGPIKAFADSYRDILGHGADALARAAIVRDYVTPHNGLHTVVWHQHIDDIPVFEATLQAHVTARGELVNIGSSFMKDPEGATQKTAVARSALANSPTVSARQAVAIAARDVGLTLAAEEVTPDGAPEGSSRRQRFVSAPLSDVTARYVWLPMDAATARLCWQVELLNKARGEGFKVLLDVETGETLVRHGLTKHAGPASYRVFAGDSPTPFSPGHATPSTAQPSTVARALVTLSALNSVASPNGWIADGVFETRGNNVDAHTDLTGDNVADTPRPQASGTARVFDFALDLTLAPSTYRDASVVNLFYWCNWMHDQLYALGFTEPAGNFQNDNFGRGGFGNDAVQAEAQDSAGLTATSSNRNNAGFFTPSDGSPGRMQMYLFDGPTPDRDGGLDQEIVLHEYTHGMSDRLVGGGVGISAAQTLGMGEGWSDFYALALLSAAGDDPNACYPIGGYSSHQLTLPSFTQNHYFGYRRYPYSTDLTKNPLTFRDIDSAQANAHTGIARSPLVGVNYGITTDGSDPHNMGEVWCVTLWEARARLIAKLGYTAGNQLILQLVTDGMKLCPANPSFLQSRDAILQAELVNTGGANRSELWSAFAKRGMGARASSPSSGTSSGVVENFELPDSNAPSISNIADQVIRRNSSTSALAFAIFDEQIPASSVTVSGSSSNTMLVPNAYIVFGGSGVNRTVTVTPLANQTGTATITVTVSDGALTSFDTFVVTVVTPPDNDAFVDATLIVGANLQVTGSNSNAFKETGEPSHAGDVGGHSVWWKWVAPTSGTFGFSTVGSNFYTLLAVYTGSAVETLTLVASDNDSGSNNRSMLTFAAVAGTTYWIAVDGYHDATGSIMLTLGVPPANDAFANAIPITGTSAQLTGNNLFATEEPGEPDYSVRRWGRHSVWWKWVAPVSGRFGFDTLGSNFDTQLGIYTGSAVNALTTIASNDDTWFSEYIEMVTSDVTFDAVAGTTYWIKVDGTESDDFASQGSIILHLGTPPANDMFANAIPITGTSAQVTGSNMFASLEAGEPYISYSEQRRSVWWKWVAPTSGTFSINTVGSSFSTELAVYTGSAVNALTPIAAASSSLTFAAVNGTTYSIRVVGSYFGSGSIILQLDLPPTNNDAFANAFLISGSSAHVTGNNVFATREPGEPYQNTAYGGSASVWWKWVAPASGLVGVNTVGSSFDAPLGVYTGSTVNALTTVAWNNNSNDSLPSTVTFNAVSGTTFWFAVYGYYDHGKTVTGSIILNLGFGVPIISAIVNQTVNEDTPTAALAFTVGDLDTAVTSLTVSGSSSNSTLVPNANIVFGGSGANRTVTATPAANQSGTATITLTVSDGEFTASRSFVLTVSTVNDTPTITNLANVTVNEDTPTGPLALIVGDVESATASLAMSVSSSNTTLVPNANIVFAGSGAHRTVTVTPAANQTGTARITLTVTDGALTTTTQFDVTVNPVNDPPTISSIGNQTINAGGSTAALAFRVTDVETAAAGLTVTGASDNSALVPNANIVFGGSGGNRTVTVTPAAGQSGAATITVTVGDGALQASIGFLLTVGSTQVPIITAQPVSQVAITGGSGGFSVSANNPVGGALSYQWYFTPLGGSARQQLNDTAGELVGTHTMTLTVSNAQAADVGDYVCVVANTAGSTSSSAAQLVVAARVFYVNDNALTNDVWCTAVGNDANDGLSPATPKATVQAILAAYDLEPGDTVRIDTGAYVLTSNINIESFDGGSATAPVMFEGSPYGTVINRNNTNSGAYVWQVDAPYVTLRTASSSAYPGLAQSGMKITGGQHGVYLTSVATGVLLSRLQVENNSNRGVHVDGSGVIVENCLVRGGATGIYLSPFSSAAQTIRNCTVVGFSSMGIDSYYDSGLNLSNSIVMADGANRTGVYLQNGGTPAGSNYNDLVALNGAKVGYAGGAARTTLAAWQSATTKDTNSISLDPLFVSATDFHLQSTAGSYHDGAWTADAADSPGIDAGDPASPVGNEASPNGGRINFGAYGGTEQASRTMAGRRLQMVSPNGGEILAGTVTVRWLATGMAWQAGDLVKLEYSVDGGTTWQIITGAAGLVYNAGQFDWNTTPVAGSGGRVRVSANGGSGATDVGDGVSLLRNVPPVFYVNDASLTNDVWCTAVGDDTNDGLSSAKPKETVQAILAVYDLEPGDIVRIDTGTYTLTSNISVGSSDGGSASAPVVFEGSPYGTVINRNSTVSGAYAWQVDAPYVILRAASSTAYPALAQIGMKITGGYSYGVYLTSAATNGILSRLQLENNGYGAFVDSSGVIIENCLVRGGTTGIYLSASTSAVRTIRDCTVVSFSSYGIFSSNATGLSLSNTIVVADGAGRIGVYLQNGSTPVGSNYNDLVALSGASVGYAGGTRSTLAAWQSATTKDANSISVDPLFVSATDYHLQSTAGSYHGGAWTADASDSPGIDAGDPASAVGTEPSPNGGRINLGAYGGTEQASRTLAGRRLRVLSPNGGENLAGTVTIRWQATGMAWQAGDTVKLEYSVDGGTNWEAISGATILAYNVGQFDWNTTVVTGSGVRVRVSANGGSGAADASDGVAVLRNVPPVFYVNDSALTSDAWCTAVGNDANDGLSPATPKATVQAILATYDLEPGDTVRIDTGTYTLTSTISVGSSDGGSASAPVVFEGSPYGTVINRNNTSAEVWSVTAPYVTIRTANSTAYPALAQSGLKITGGYYGVYLTSAATGGLLSRLQLDANTSVGAYVDSGGVIIENCLIKGGTTGITLSSSSSAVRTIRNCTVVGFSSTGINSYYASGLSLSNTITVADGAGHTGVYLNSGSVPAASNYNNLVALNGASVGNAGGTRPTLADWKSATTKDANSISLDPLFVSTTDYHLQSTAGSYHGGAWTADAADSPGIDAGDPAAAVGSEPSPNDGRINLGAYGGTEQASRTLAGRRLQLVSPNSGENLAGTVTIRWLANGMAWQAGDTLKLEYSVDGGTTWQAITGATSLAYNAGQFDWNTTTVTGSGVRVRVSANGGSGATDASDGPSLLRNVPPVFYVNDAALANDAWCTAVGNDANDGLSPATPKATVQAILATYDLEPGDTVRIDTGTYTLTSTISVGSSDGGSASAPVVFEGSPYGTVINRNNTSAEVWSVTAPYVTIRTANSTAYPTLAQSGMKITGGYYGVYLTSAATGGLLSRLQLDANTSVGAYVDSGGVIIENCLVRGGTTGITLSSSSSAVRTIRNCTVVGFSSTGINSYYASGLNLSNTIVVADGTNRTGVYLSSGSVSTASNYNNLVALNGANVGYAGGARATLADWKSATTKDTNSISLDPLFVSATDYHLQSTAGSYHGGAWTADAGDSPGIDAGDPASAVGSEPSPNGGRINLGAYGGTEQASRTLAGRRLQVVSPNGGENLAGVVTIRWQASGMAWQPGDTVKLESSLDGGTNWQAITGATSLAYNAGLFDWDTTTVTGSGVRVRVSANGGSGATDASDGLSLLRNVPPVFYVNDASLTNDVWCTAAGNDANEGLSPATPKATVQAILAAYDLEPGDTVRIDTGSYTLTSNITIISSDGGSASAPVVFEGSPYGTVINRNSTSSGAYAWSVDASYVTFRTASSSAYPTLARNGMKITGAYRGVYLTGNATNCLLSRLLLDTNLESGVYVDFLNSGHVIENCIVRGGSYGLYLLASNPTTIRNCTVVGFSSVGIYVTFPAGLNLSNTIVMAEGAGRTGIYQGSGSLPAASNYNDLVALNGASVGYASGTRSTLDAWKSATGKDTNSISSDPLFVNATDYRLRSTSPCIDKGTTTSLTLDIIGTLRPLDGNSDSIAALDIGAYEFDPTAHSADVDQDFRINLVEVTRVIELYITRNGTVRTGAYKLQDGSEDSFASDSTREAGSVAALSRFHSADTTTSGPRDGRIDLGELTRVIQLYNHRSGTVRTGQYHVQITPPTEDGFAPGP